MDNKTIADNMITTWIDEHGNPHTTIKVLNEVIDRLLEEISDLRNNVRLDSLDTSEVRRVEVIQHSEPYNGRAYSNYNAKEVELQIQDNGKTLKIFLK